MSEPQPTFDFSKNNCGNFTAHPLHQIIHLRKKISEAHKNKKSGQHLTLTEMFLLF